MKNNNITKENDKVMAKAIMFGIMENENFDFLEELTEEEKAERISQEMQRRHMLRGAISEVRMGSMRFALIPIDLLIPNEEYQRVYTIDYSKVDDLASKWDCDLAGVITVAEIPGSDMYEVIDGWHRVLAAKINGITHLAARLIDLPEDLEERLIRSAEIFTKQGTDPLSKADRFKAEVIKGTREYVIVNEAIKGKKYLISRQCINNERDEEKKKEYINEWSVITGLSSLLEAGCTSKGEIVVRQTLSVLEKANWIRKRLGLSGEIIRTIYKIINLHNNDENYAEAIAEYLVNLEPELFQANAMSEYPMRRRLERQMMFLEREVSRNLGIEPIYVGGNLNLYK